MNLRNPAAMVLFVTLFIDNIGWAIVMPVLPFYARDLGASPFETGLLLTIFSLMQFVSAPFWGTLSDRVGRKPLVLIGVFGFGVSHLLFGLADSMWLLTVSRFIGGVLSSAVMPAALAYVADVTSDEDRGSAMGLMNAAMGIGVVLGPALGGLLAGISLSAPFFTAAAISFLDVTFAFFFLRESLHQNRRVNSLQRLPQIRLMLRSLASPIGFPLILTFLSMFAVANLEGTFAFWIQDKLGYGATDMGIIFVAMALTMAVVQGGLVGRLISAFGEELVIRAGLVIAAVGFLLLPLSSNLLYLIIFGAIWSAGESLMRTALPAIISKRATSGLGAAMGLQGSFDSLGRIAGPLWGGFVYQHNISLPYLSGAGLLFVSTAATMVSAFWMRPVRDETSVA